MLRASVAMILFTGNVFARQPNAAELQRAVERTNARVLYVAAHPDDENTRLLAWLVNEKGVRAAYLSLTRGEGGQNLIGSEQAPLLGVIRTEELLAARSIDGAEQMFGNERDFGYSKNPEETLKIWGHDEALGDVVWAIRKFRPDVIVTRFSPELRDTHGHHTASAMLALEAFTAAADAKKYPEQLKWVQPWQAKRIVWNKGVWPGAPKEDLSGFLSLDVGGYNPVLGASYGEIAARSRSMHKSQGFGASPSRGPAMEYFKLLAGEPMKSGFLDGVNLTRPSLKIDPEHPENAIAALEAAKASGELIANCAGLYADAVADDHVVAQGGERTIKMTIVNRSHQNLVLKEVKLGGQSVAVGKSLPYNEPLEISHAVKIDAPLSQPFWLRDEPSAGRWTVSDQTLVGLPVAPAPSAEFIFDKFSISRPIDFAWNDPVAGERRRPLEVLPAVTIDVLDPLLVFTDAHAKEVRVKLTATAGPVEGELRGKKFKLEKKGDETVLTFSIPPGSGKIEFSAGPGLSTGLRRIEYPHIPIVTLSPKAEVKLVKVDLKKSGTRIGYIPGAGDEVPAALRQAGYDVTILDDEMLAHLLASGPLKFDAIVTGVRAFNVNPRLYGFNQRLLDYVNKGGVWLVQYNTQNRISRLAGEIGPAKFNISQDRVTDETVPVELADSPLLKMPNKITAADFEGWIQERGLYFADKWDDAYQAPLSMHDPGESPKKGSLLIAQHGKGRFIYTGIAFFRQLPAGVPGAFRLFANLIAHAGK